MIDDVCLYNFALLTIAKKHRLILTRNHYTIIVTVKCGLVDKFIVKILYPHYNAWDVADGIKANLMGFVVYF